MLFDTEVNGPLVETPFNSVSKYLTVIIGEVRHTNGYCPTLPVI